MEKLYERFLGYADIYNEGRPNLPKKAIEILKIYYNNKFKTIVDIGCGTGLSTEICADFANEVIGIEPSEDMLNQAKLKESNKIKFKQGFGENTGLNNEIADLVVCSQAFHWMKPKECLKEVNRILKKDGIFAIIDADYPPVINKELEIIYSYLFKKISEIEGIEQHWTTKKTEHLKNIRESNFFDYTREICFSNVEKYNKDRFKKFLFSQSSMQQAIKNNYEFIKEDIDTLDKKLDTIFKGQMLNAIYSYKMKIGIK